MGWGGGIGGQGRAGRCARPGLSRPCAMGMPIRSLQAGLNTRSEGKHQSVYFTARKIRRPLPGRQARNVRWTPGSDTPLGYAWVREGRRSPSGRRGCTRARVSARIKVYEGQGWSWGQRCGSGTRLFDCGDVLPFLHYRPPVDFLGDMPPLVEHCGDVDMVAEGVTELEVGLPGKGTGRVWWGSKWVGREAPRSGGGRAAAAL